MQDHPLPGWTCIKCGSQNDEDAVNCVLCDHPNPHTESYADLANEEYETDSGILVSSGR